MKAPRSHSQKGNGIFHTFLSNQSPYQRKLLGCFLLVSFALFTVFSLLVLRASDKRYHDELRAMGQQTIEQARNTSDDLLLNVFRYGLLSVTSDPIVTQMMYKSTFEAQDSIAAQNLLAEIQKYNDYVNNIYIINFENESVLTNTGRVQLSSFYDAELIEYINALPVSSIPVRYVPRVATVRSQSGLTSQERVWTVIFHTSYKGAFVMNVNYDAYVKLLNVPSYSPSLHNYIINGYGQVLVGSSPDDFAQDMTDSPLLAAVKAQPARSGSFTFTGSGSAQTVYYIQNAYLGLTYISAVDETPFGTGNALFLTILGLSVLFLVLSVLLSILLASAVYRPVRQLSDEMNLEPAPQGYDEFGQIRAAYSKMLQHNATLEMTAEAYQRAEEGRMLLKWVDPAAITKKYKPEQYDAINTYYTGLCYCCVLFSIDLTAETTEDLGLLKYSILNMMGELAEGQFLCKPIDYAVNQIVFLCNADSFDRAAMRRVVETVQNVFRQHFRLPLSAAVGLTVDDTDDLPQSLQTAKQAVARRFANGDGLLVFCDETENIAGTEGTYPQEQEAQLLQAVRAGDKPQIQRELAAFFDAVRPCRMESILLYLLQLDLACQKLEAANHLDTQPLDMSDFYFATSSLNALQERFAARLDAVADSILQLRESNSEKLIAQVNKLVADNLCDPNLSVTYLADEVKLSVNYLRNVYKEATGESLSGAITRAKLDLICNLLETSDLTIQDISEKLGFTTRNYFFTFFKKHMGMTPKQYRLMRGNLSD